MTRRVQSKKEVIFAQRQRLKIEGEGEREGRTFIRSSGNGTRCTVKASGRMRQTEKRGEGRRKKREEKTSITIRYPRSPLEATVAIRRFDRKKVGLLLDLNVER